ncbi:MAG: UDP-4-amino-4,6-dideoxy-N-acetyl-beta-L-altrosamine transaminase [Candidatus Zixiibacteriota bacterium]
MPLSNSHPGFLPYGRQSVTPGDIQAVIEVLQSDWWTQGPMIEQFEHDLACRIGATYAVACSSGTAALHLAMLALGLGDGDAIVTSPNTFVASANGARYTGAEVLFAEIDAATGNMNPDRLETLLAHDTPRRIKAVVPVHFAGLPCDIERIARLADRHGAVVVEDACHALGATIGIEGSVHAVGSNTHSAMTVFSFHPVKHVAMGEGGAVTTNDAELAERLRRFRSHGIVRNEFVNADLAYAPDGKPNPWYYEMSDLGFNYRLTDLQAVLGRSQLQRLDASVARRQELARAYSRKLQEAFVDGTVRPLHDPSVSGHAFHLFVVRIDFARRGVSRAKLMTEMRRHGIGTQVHYIPVPMQPYYRKRYGFKQGDFPVSEEYYAQALSLPMYPELTIHDIERVVTTLRDLLADATDVAAIDPIRQEASSC